MPPWVGVFAAYLLGSIPAAYIAGRVTHGIDLREHGSRNLGATNAYRVLGWKVALPVLLFDALKGAVPVLYFPAWLGTVGASAWWPIAYGLSAIVGHARPIFLLWRGGGKGVATAAGVFFALAPAVMLVTVIAWAGILFLTGYVSLASLVSAIVLPVLLAWRSGVRSPVFIVSVVVAIFVFWTHRANMTRLRRGDEHRFGRKKGSDESEGGERRDDDRAGS